MFLIKHKASEIYRAVKKIRINPLEEAYEAVINEVNILIELVIIINFFIDY